MAHLPIQCQNCGAKYKIPETFAGDFAKCKACGTKIDVNAARAGKSTEAAASPRSSTKRATGGSRKPREAAETKASGRSRRGKAKDQEEASPKRGRRGAQASTRRGRQGADEEGEDGERHHYEKKKDNTPLILGASVGGLAVVAVILFMFWKGDDKTPEADTSKVAAQTEADAAAKKQADDAKAAQAKVAEAAAKKADEVKAAEATAKKKAAAKKSKIKKEAEIKTAADVYKPSVLAELPRIEGTSDEELSNINSLLDDLKEGGGLAFIRAPKKLHATGAKMIPLAINRMMTLDYAKAEDNQYAFAISEAIKRLTEFELAFDPARIIDEFELKQGHANAIKVKDLHYLARKKWNSDAAIKKHIASRR